MTDYIRLIEAHNIHVGGSRYGQIQDSKERREMIDLKNNLTPPWDVDIFSQCYSPSEDRGYELTNALAQFFIPFHTTYRLNPASPPIMPGQRHPHSADTKYMLQAVKLIRVTRYEKASSPQSQVLVGLPLAHVQTVLPPRCTGVDVNHVEETPQARSLPVESRRRT